MSETKFITTLRFICGCWMEVEALDMIGIVEAGLEFDNDGFITCAMHKQRRYGWRSLPMLTLEANPDDPESIPPVKPDYNLASYTPLELERYVVFGVDLPERAAQI